MGYGQISANVLYQDSTTAITRAEEDKYSGKAKQISVRYHYTTEQIRPGKIKLEYLCTLEMLANVLTKIVADPELKRFREMLGLREL